VNDNTRQLRFDGDDCQGMLVANFHHSILSNTMYVVVEQSWTTYIRLDEENQLDPFVFTVEDFGAIVVESSAHTESANGPVESTKVGDCVVDSSTIRTRQTRIARVEDVAQDLSADLFWKGFKSRNSCIDSCVQHHLRHR